MATSSSALHSVTKFGAFLPDQLAQLLAGFSMGGLFNEFAQDNITATGSTQATAFQTSGQTIRVATVAANTGILLPPAASGLEVLVINHGANDLQVYGNGIDTIDDVATATGVSQMALSFVLYSCATGATPGVAGKWYSEGLANGFAGGLQTVSTLDNITAAGTNQGNATVLPAKMAYNVTTVGAGTGVLLPASVRGAELAVNNNQGTNALLVYANGTDTINALAAGTGFSVAVNTVVIFYCFTAGKWFTK